MAVTKDVSNLAEHLYKEGFLLIQKSNLFELDHQNIKELQKDFLFRDLNNRIISLITASVGIEYLLKAFLLTKNIDIFKKYENSVTDISDGFSFVTLSSKTNRKIEIFLKNNNIKMANQLDTKNFSSLLNLIDQVKMEDEKREKLKNSLHKFKDKIRNRFIHLTYGIMQISPSHFDDFYIPAINTLINEIKSA